MSLTELMNSAPPAADSLPALSKALGRLLQITTAPLTPQTVDALRNASELIRPDALAMPYQKTALQHADGSTQRLLAIVRRVAGVNHQKEPQASRCAAAANLLHGVYGERLKHGTHFALETAARSFANKVASQLGKPAPFIQPPSRAHKISA